MTEWTREIDGFRFKNDVRKEGDGWLVMKVPGPLSGPVEIIMNLSDSPLIHDHRWRLVEARVLTVVQSESGLAHTIALQNVILRRPRTEKVYHVTDNTLDFRRVNLQPARNTPSLPPHPISVDGDIARIHANNGNAIVIDRNQIERVQSYRWMVNRKPSQSSSHHATVDVRAKVLDPTCHEYKSLTLARLILDVPHGAKYRVKHINGDYLDYRVTNLLLKEIKGASRN
jgi:hypothetical protein